MTIQFIQGHGQNAAGIEALFVAVFTASEGAAEGQLIGSLVHDLVLNTPENDRYVFSAVEEGELLGCIILSRLRYEQDDRQVFVLSPVAVGTDRQKGGIGQALIAHGLAHMRAAGVDFVVTYGDPNYYSKTGFQPMSQAFAQPPLPLSHPHGWLGQCLAQVDGGPLRGPSRCVAALNRPELW